MFRRLKCFQNKPKYSQKRALDCLHYQQSELNFVPTAVVKFLFFLWERRFAFFFFVLLCKVCRCQPVKVDVQITLWLVSPVALVMLCLCTCQQLWVQPTIIKLRILTLNTQSAVQKTCLNHGSSVSGSKKGLLIVASSRTDSYPSPSLKLTRQLINCLVLCSGFDSNEDSYLWSLGNDTVQSGTWVQTFILQAYLNIKQVTTKRQCTPITQ